VSQFKYSGHIISETANDDDDLRRETRNLFVRTNALISKCYLCCINVKLVLFETFCLCMYDVTLWKYYSVTVLINSNLCTINVLILGGFARRNNMSGILMDLPLASADTVVHNSRVLLCVLCPVTKQSYGLML